LSPSGLTANYGNYTITNNNASFTIVPANVLLVQVTSVAKTYGTTTPLYSATAQYLTCTVSGCPSTGSSNVIHDLTSTISGSALSVSDSAGGSAAFTITPVSALNGGSGYMNAGGYQLSATNVSVTSNNFNNTIVLTGALTVNPLILSVSELGVYSVPKVYNGNAAISGVTLNTNADSRILAGDIVSVIGTGMYADANVGTNKAVIVAVGLNGTDASNYALSNSQLTANIGTITQLASVTYTGNSGGNWSNASNWAGGAIPTLSNVAQVIIPVSKTVVYDVANLTGLIPTSSIVDNGTLSFTSLAPITFANTISGTGSVDVSGIGALTLMGNNSYSGGTNIASVSSLIAGSNSSIGTGAVTSSGGTFSTLNNVMLQSLLINGSVTLASDIDTSGDQTYSGSGDQTHIDKVTLGQSISLLSSTGAITFNTDVGNTGISNKVYIDYFAHHNTVNPYNLIVLASNININADITTYGTQTYGSSTSPTKIFIGDNGRNGNTRVLVSEDPAVTFNGTVDDASANTHNLIVSAVSYAANEIPTINFNKDVGSTAPLLSLAAKTGRQTTAGAPLFTDISSNSNDFVGTVSILGNVTTQGNQTYTANTIELGNNVSNSQTFKTTGGNVTFNIGTTPTGGFRSSNNNLSVNFDLNGGTHTNLNGSGISYTDTSYQSNQNSQNSGSGLRSGIDAGLRSGIDAGGFMVAQKTNNRMDIAMAEQMLISLNEGTVEVLEAIDIISSCDKNLPLPKECVGLQNK